MRAEVTADNTSIRVSWEWSRQGVPMCIDLVGVYYQPDGGSLMMYMVDNTTTTSATLPNLQCSTEYNVWVHVASGSHMTANVNASRMVALPARGMYRFYYALYLSVVLLAAKDTFIMFILCASLHVLQPLPLPLGSLLGP